jgi:uncharacterized protein (DUF2252 family)
LAGERLQIERKLNPERHEMINPGDRPKVLTAIRNLKMARSAHAFVRGSTERFYQWLESSTRCNLPEGPPIWICGDCHLGNLGPLADSKGRVVIQIRDLDQTVIGNPAHDLVRLGLSLASAARSSDLPGVATARILEELIAGYQNALKGDFRDLKERDHRPKLIQELLVQSTRRRWRHLAEERLDTVEPKIPLGSRFWKLTQQERKELARLVESDEIRPTLASLKGHGENASVALVDAAYWQKGCSSLGRLRYAALLRIDEGGKSRICLIDIKEGVTAAAPRAKAAKMPKDNGERVVAGARALSPNLGQRLMAAKLFGKSVVIRELMPQDLKIEIESLGVDEALRLSRYLASVVGRAHGRQMDPRDRTAWHLELKTRSTSSMNAPSWLWQSVVELTSLHEAAYLDHCRRYALSEAA